MKNSKHIFLWVVISLLIASCNDEYIPKPKGFFRVDLPQKNYKKYTSKSPYSFEAPEYALIAWNKKSNDTVMYEDIHFNQLKATVHLTYVALNNNLRPLTEQARKMVYDHSARAGGIEEGSILIDSSNVFGRYYTLKGKAASNIQFYVSDSSKHFLRGVLYFYARPNPDSLKPFVEYVDNDLKHLINTLEWKP